MGTSAFPCNWCFSMQWHQLHHNGIIGDYILWMYDRMSFHFRAALMWICAFPPGRWRSSICNKAQHVKWMRNYCRVIIIYIIYIYLTLPLLTVFPTPLSNITKCFCSVCTYTYSLYSLLLRKGWYMHVNVNIICLLVDVLVAQGGEAVRRMRSYCRVIIISVISISSSPSPHGLSHTSFHLHLRSHLPLLPTFFFFIPLSYTPNPVKPINHMVIDWPHRECLNPRLGARVAHQIRLLFVLDPRHGGIFTWRAQIPVVEEGRKERAILTERAQGQYKATITDIFKGTNCRLYSDGDL